MVCRELVYWALRARNVARGRRTAPDSADQLLREGRWPKRLVTERPAGQLTCFPLDSSAIIEKMPFAVAALDEDARRLPTFRGLRQKATG